ncbi:hypothetical protein ACTQZS_13825 [Bilifractor sp. LCP19S3_H10]|uniref:hypothetical protein n=1 Tax=Bilifractor sp. LCP19S3_H10 TaxID=3438736 RepID=UPI003F8EBA15
MKAATGGFAGNYGTRRICKQFLRFKIVYDILTKWLRSHGNALLFSLFGIPEGLPSGLML